MKRLMMILAVAGLILAISGPARANMVRFEFDPNDMLDLFPAAAGDEDVSGENKATQQDARRVHQIWANTFYETFYNPEDAHTQSDDYNTYVNWRASLGDNEGISGFNTWLLDNPNARSWGETIVSRTNAPTGSATAADGWTAEVLSNPWGAGYLVQWSTDDPSKYLRPGGADIGTFSFTVDVYVDTDADGWDEDDLDVAIGETYRIWLGGVNSTDPDGAGWTYDWSIHFDAAGWGSLSPVAAGPFAAGLLGSEGYGSGWEGVLDMTAGHPIPVPEPGALSLVGLGLVGLVRRKRRT